MAKATRHGHSNAATAVPQSVQDLDALDEVLDDANTPAEPEPQDHDDVAGDDVEEAPAAAGEPVAPAAVEPPKRNASQPAWADFLAAHYDLADAHDMSRDELVSWYEDQV